MKSSDLQVVFAICYKVIPGWKHFLSVVHVSCKQLFKASLNFLFNLQNYSLLSVAVVPVGGLLKNYDSITNIQIEAMWLRLLVEIALG